MSKPVRNGGVRGSMLRNRTSKEEGKMLPYPDTQTDNENEDDNKSPDTHQVLKNNKVFKGLFESFDALSLKVINNKEWGCPACKVGLRAKARYKSMEGLIQHAKVTKNWNGRLHEKLVKVLEEELKRRRVACSVAQHVYGKWLGLENAYGEHEIVWPPMVVVQNTNSDLSDNQHKTVGMGTKELLEKFKQYKPTKAMYAYGPKGHYGVSLLIFEDSALGYLEADCLHTDFKKERRGKEDWDQSEMLNHSSGKRILYGYIATSEDIDNFNKHSTKAKVKYDMVSYQSKFIEPVKKMKESNQKVVWLETKIVEDQERSKQMEEKINKMADQTHIHRESMKNLMKKSMEHADDFKKGIDYIENYYKRQIDQLVEEGYARSSKCNDSKLTNM